MPQLVMFLPGLFTGNDPTWENLAGRVGSGREVFKKLTGRVGSGRIQTSRVGPGHPDPTRPARIDLAREKSRFKRVRGGYVVWKARPPFLVP